MCNLERTELLSCGDFILFTNHGNILVAQCIQTAGRDSEYIEENNRMKSNANIIENY
jgi:hypothetical protein